MRLLALVLAAGGALWAATTVQELHLTGPDGKPATGTLTITPTPQFSAADGSRVEAVAKVKVVNGRFAVALTANAGSTPASQYRVAWAIDGAQPRSEMWAVPATGSVLRVVDVAVPAATMGTASGSGSFADAEAPGGAVNGSNLTFTLAHAPSPAASLILLRNGLVQSAGVDYTLAGATITFLTGLAPGSGDLLVAWYRYGGGA